jgi:hypothetical protein
LGFSDEVEIAAKNLPVPHNNKRKWVKENLGEESKEFDKLVADVTIDPRAIWEVLTKRGLDVHLNTVNRWCKEERNVPKR